MQNKRLTFSGHLEELRSRIIKSIIFVIILSALTYNFTDKIISSLARPIGRLVFIAPAEAFVINIKIAVLGGLFLSSPFILYQIWRFIAEGLTADERKYVVIFAPVSFMFFILGACFGYFIIVPIGIKFLLGFATDIVSPMISIDRYISFVGALIFSFGAIFQIPLALLFLTKAGLVNPVFLSKKRRHAIVVIFIVSAIFTPPDVITQCLMAVPLIILYEIGIIFSKFAYK